MQFGKPKFLDNNHFKMFFDLFWRTSQITCLLFNIEDGTREMEELVQNMKLQQLFPTAGRMCLTAEVCIRRLDIPGDEFNKKIRAQVYEFEKTRNASHLSEPNNCERVARSIYAIAHHTAHFCKTCFKVF